MSIIDWFGRKESNVVDFPKDYIKPAPPPEPTNVFYRIGVTDNNSVALQIGYSELTMTRAGVQNLIDQLSVFRDQLIDSAEDE
jgi:hypothetical protein